MIFKINGDRATVEIEPTDDNIQICVYNTETETNEFVIISWKDWVDIYKAVTEYGKSEFNKIIS